MYLDAFAKLRKSGYYFRLVCLSVRTPAWNNSASNGRGFHEILYLGVFFKSVKKIQVLLKYEIILGTLHEDRCTFCIISRSVVLTMRNISDESCRQNQNTHFVFSKFFSKNRSFWYNTEKYCRGSRAQITIWRMHIACWIPKATNSHLKCVIHVVFQL